MNSATVPQKRIFYGLKQPLILIFQNYQESVQEWGLNDLVNNSSKILKGEVSGRVIVNVNK